MHFENYHAICTQETCISTTAWTSIVTITMQPPFMYLGSFFHGYIFLITWSSWVFIIATILVNQNDQWWSELYASTGNLRCGVVCWNQVQYIIQMHLQCSRQSTVIHSCTHRSLMPILGIVFSSKHLHPWGTALCWKLLEYAWVIKMDMR